MHSFEQTLTALREHFGFSEFREGQRAVVAAILAGKDAVVVMPTGSGKSLCYQLPAMILEGATLVVSPLIALMKDQVDALQALNLPATFINSSLSEREQWTRIEAVRRGDFKLVYVAPERFRSSLFVSALESIKVSLFAVDEAHCISTWGHDFRPDYLRLKHVRSNLKAARTLALTATATPYVRSDIIQQLGLIEPQTFVSGFDRPNLSIKVVHTNTVREKLKCIERLTGKLEGSGIVYASTRKAVEEVTEKLRERQVNVSAYHAGMPDALRVKAQDDFMCGRTRIIVATNAFGMGIDKPDIRFVVHYQLPGSIEAYYQEIGRAGRDGLPASCLLLFNYADKNTHDFFIDGSYPSSEIVRDVYDALKTTGQSRIELSASEIAKRAGTRNEMAVQSALYLLEQARHIERVGREDVDGSRKRSRAIVMLDTISSPQLRVDHHDVIRRGELERRKLREMIEFCYSADCYRAFILDYFGDTHGSRLCGTCGNCDPKTAVTHFHTVQEALAVPESDALLRPRELSEEELIRVRKILSCAKRMNGRFGKTLLVQTLRGSAAKNVFQARLNTLSTYGILKELSQEEVAFYVEKLTLARCLVVNRGTYPTISITELGERVMRLQETILLEFPPQEKIAPQLGRSGANVASNTMLETYTLFEQGLSIHDIASRRNCTQETIEEHLLGCLRIGYPIDIHSLVTDKQRSLIEAAAKLHPGERLKIIKETLPDTITYNMIRFVLEARTSVSAQ